VRERGGERKRKRERDGGGGGERHLEAVPVHPGERDGGHGVEGEVPGCGDIAPRQAGQRVAVDALHVRPRHEAQADVQLPAHLMIRGSRSC
jgi:hypothetical protein